jgi:hypothetical protein
MGTVAHDISLYRDITKMVIGWNISKYFTNTSLILVMSLYDNL